MEYAFNSTNVTHFVYGVSANVVAVLLYGTNYVPVKRIEMGDGMFFHWVSCSAIWLVSLIGDLMLQSPKFYPLAMLGGVIWATGNIAAVSILKTVGFGLGIIIWGTSSLLMAWASSRFGWFGIAASPVSRPVLNYSGAGMCLLSVLILFFVKTDAQLHPPPESTPLLFDRRTNSGSFGPPCPEFWMDSIGPKSRRFIGCLLAVLSGLLYGSSLVPILYIKSHSSCHDSIFHGASVYDLDYIYAQCSGIFLASTVYFAIYCAARSNRPRVYSRAILPGHTGVKTEHLFCLCVWLFHGQDKYRCHIPGVLCVLCRSIVRPHVDISHIQLVPGQSLPEPSQYLPHCQHWIWSGGCSLGIARVQGD
ncbi:transmembrane protein 144b isoform X3 [Boleophthalmus pectinirostris]|uniref:transmembrane protein 144b isoform X3 n=1 Tax=Boleophthalmus pectinirostris TaxID=150288 RepID=UPI00242DFF63|nr:transmembrane protein 144b isoform X3 [Boleophthalmus pectinirostris]XP_055015249.1 transmembrane protein 144b isoform X3 [Boleophthalmus pectinirostris]